MKRYYDRYFKIFHQSAMKIAKAAEKDASDVTWLNCSKEEKLSKISTIISSLSDVAGLYRRTVPSYEEGIIETAKSRVEETRKIIERNH